jgi:hypothetical protein
MSLKSGLYVPALRSALAATVVLLGSLAYAGSAAADIVVSTPNLTVTSGQTPIFAAGAGYSFYVNDNARDVDTPSGSVTTYACGSYFTETLYCGQPVFVQPIAASVTIGGNSQGASVGTSLVTAGTLIGPGTSWVQSYEFASQTPQSNATGPISFTQAGYSYSCGFLDTQTCYGENQTNVTGPIFSGLASTGQTGRGLYLPISLLVSGTTLYGWALVDIEGADTGYSVAVGEIAYDTTGAAIIAGSTVPAVPLPPAVWLMLSGIGALGALARRRKTAEPHSIAAGS